VLRLALCIMFVFRLPSCFVFSVSRIATIMVTLSLFANRFIGNRWLRFSTIPYPNI
jgi:hypothetical protein